MRDIQEVTARFTKPEPSVGHGAGGARVLLRVYPAPIQKPLNHGRVGDAAAAAYAIGPLMIGRSHQRLDYAR